jgi:hypothetical protein
MNEGSFSKPENSQAIMALAAHGLAQSVAVITALAWRTIVVKAGIFQSQIQSFPVAVFIGTAFIAGPKAPVYPCADSSEPRSEWALPYSARCVLTVAPAQHFASTSTDEGNLQGRGAGPVGFKVAPNATLRRPPLSSYKGARVDDVILLQDPFDWQCEEQMQ